MPVLRRSGLISERVRRLIALELLAVFALGVSSTSEPTQIACHSASAETVPDPASLRRSSHASRHGSQFATLSFK